MNITNLNLGRSAALLLVLILPLAACGYSTSSRTAKGIKSIAVPFFENQTAEPALEVAAMPPDSYFLVMTHSHALDFDICDRVLRRGDARYCGLIGSLSKRRRFEKRYRQQGMPQALIDTLVCPIGVDGITGKKPAEIAVSVAAEVLRLRDLAAGSSAEGLAANVHPIGA